MEAVAELTSFPDPASVKKLQSLGIRYVIVHRGFYEDGKYTELAMKLVATPGLTRWGIYKDPVGVADILEVAP
jgi:hypothetical protein